MNEKDENQSSNVPTPTPPEKLSNLGLEDATGGTSSMRVIMVYGTFLVLITWAAVAITAAYHGKYEIPDLPLQISILIGGLVGAKVTQRVMGER